MAAESARIHEVLISARLESARYDALARASAGADRIQPLIAPNGTPKALSAEIVTGRQSVMDFFLDPIGKMISEELKVR